MQSNQLGWALLTAASLLLVGSRLARTEPAPGPHPTPAPFRVDLADRARAALEDAPVTDRADIGAMAAAMSRLLDRDGRLTAPRIPSTHVMAEAWVALQQLHRGADSPFGDKYPAFESLLGEVFPETETKFDAALRAECAAKFAAIAEGLE